MSQHHSYRKQIRPSKHSIFHAERKTPRLEKPAKPEQKKDSFLEIEQLQKKLGSLEKLASGKQYLFVSERKKLKEQIQKILRELGYNSFSELVDKKITDLNKKISIDERGLTMLREYLSRDRPDSHAATAKRMILRQEEKVHRLKTLLSVWREKQKKYLPQ